MQHKPSDFNKNSYDRVNQLAIDLFKPFLIGKSYEIIEKAEDYNVDIQAIDKDGTLHLFELEIKTGYPFTTCESFKFDTVSFLARKAKWKKTPFWYIIICRETNHFVCCNSLVIFQPQYQEKININSSDRKGKDLFFRVPKELCHWSKL